VGSGVKISNTHSYESLAETETSQKRERLAKRVVDLVYERKRFTPSPPLSSSGGHPAMAPAAVLSTIFTFWP
jgi:hypothetical protein